MRTELKKCATCNKMEIVERGSQVCLLCEAEVKALVEYFEGADEIAVKGGFLG